ncbi:MAG: hypothetical protein K6E40_03700 [Desulfovibrio sp.]|nr:hypothetical protein [Desulfovibrio sp.]
MSDARAWYDSYVERETARQEQEPLRRQAAILARELSRNRILVNHARCCQCPDYGAEACAKCWLEWSARRAKEEAE